MGRLSERLNRHALIGLDTWVIWKRHGRNKSVFGGGWKPPESGAPMRTPMKTLTGASNRFRDEAPLLEIENAVGERVGQHWVGGRPEPAQVNQAAGARDELKQRARGRRLQALGQL